MSFQRSRDGSAADEAEARDFTVYTVRIPTQLAAEIRAEAQRRFEPASVLVRRLIRDGLHSDIPGVVTRGGKLVETR